jgi:uncharacterized protein (TIGR00299 family) protein
MHTLAFDGRTGASGDMILAALVAVGAVADALAPVEAALPVEYRIGETTKNGIAATTVDVLVEDADGDETTDDGHEHGHSGQHGRTHGHDHGHEHEHEHTHTHAEGAGPNRTYAECREIVADMDLPEPIEADALAIFERLGEAESRVHGTDLDSTHFHEVGADDAIADVVGAALLVDDLDAARVVTTPIAAGGGEVSMSHGTYPVPTPAVTYIAEGASWRLAGGPIETELLTPTGAAILAHFAEGVESLPPLSIDRVGYGAGDKYFPDHPNVLRATVGDSTGGLVRDEIRVLETNVDDVTPEVLGGLHERLADAGARDVSVVPTSMKKSRPGHLIRVIVKPSDVAEVARELAEETGTLGIRETAATHRWVAERTIEPVSIGVGDDTYEVCVKVATDDAGEAYDVSAEYDDCAAVAAESGAPTREIIRRAEAAYRESN